MQLCGEVILLIPQNGVESGCVPLLQGGLDVRLRRSRPIVATAIVLPFRRYIAQASRFSRVPLISQLSLDGACPIYADRNVIMLAPEKRCFAVSATDAEHRTRNRLSLALRHYPVLYARRVA